MSAAFSIPLRNGSLYLTGSMGMFIKKLATVWPSAPSGSSFGLRYQPESLIEVWWRMRCFSSYTLRSRTKSRSSAATKISPN